MSDEQRRVVDDAAVERRLRELGPLIQRLDQIDGDAAPPAFVRDLRARLLQETPVADERAAGPAPTRGAAQGNADRRPDRKRTRRVRPAWWAVVATAALVAALVAVVVPRWHGQRQGAVNVAAGLPRPSTGDLTHGYPPPPGEGGGGGGILTPTMSAFDPDPVPPYYGPGPLRLTIGALPRMASRLPAYQLDAPLDSARLAALARRLGIPDHVARTRVGGATWLVVANGTGMPGPHVPPLHSLAVSTATGEVIFHDERYQNVDPHLRVPTRARAIADAGTWLARLDWPGQRMPVLDAKLAYGIWTIDLGWPGIAATTPAVTVEITPGDHVDDVRLWPPLARSYHAPARALSGAWAALQKGKIPLAVTETNPNDMFTPTGGHATVQRVDVAQVLVPGTHGRSYLVPAYRFAGTAHLTSGKKVAPGTNATWYALVPALQH